MAIESPDRDREILENGWGRYKIGQNLGAPWVLPAIVPLSGSWGES